MINNLLPLRYTLALHLYLLLLPPNPHSFDVPNSRLKSVFILLFYCTSFIPPIVFSSYFFTDERHKKYEFILIKTAVETSVSNGRTCDAITMWPKHANDLCTEPEDENGT
jgi:hypothetical protein